jgi:hypothetical protein
MAIRNAGLSADIKVITLSKLKAKWKGKCLEISTTHSRDLAVIKK